MKSEANRVAMNYDVVELSAPGTEQNLVKNCDILMRGRFQMIYLVCGLFVLAVGMSLLLWVQLPSPPFLPPIPTTRLASLVAKAKICASP